MDLFHENWFKNIKNKHKYINYDSVCVINISTNLDSIVDFGIINKLFNYSKLIILYQPIKGTRITQSLLYELSDDNLIIIDLSKMYDQLSYLCQGSINIKGDIKTNDKFKSYLQLSTFKYVKDLLSFKYDDIIDISSLHLTESLSKTEKKQLSKYLGIDKYIE